MKKTYLSALIALASISAFGVKAQSNWNIGVMYTDQDVGFGDRDMKTAGLILNYKLTEHYSFEARIAKSVKEHKLDWVNPIGNYREKIDYQNALYFKAAYPIFREFTLYGLAGYTESELEIESFGERQDGSFYPATFEHKESGFAYGVGLDYEINSQFSIFVEHQKLPNYEVGSIVSYDWKITSLGINYRF